MSRFVLLAFFIAGLDLFGFNFKTGDYVQVQDLGDSSTLNVRNDPVNNVIGSVKPGAGVEEGRRGIVLESPVTATLHGVAYNWYHVFWAETSTRGSSMGWSVENGLEVASPTNLRPGTETLPGPILDDLPVTIQWERQLGATSYSLHVRDLTTGLLVFDQNILDPNQQSLTLSSPTLQRGARYRWNMLSYRGNAESLISDSLYFQIADLPACEVSHVSPSAHDILFGSTGQRFSWTVSGSCPFLSIALGNSESKYVFPSQGNNSVFVSQDQWNNARRAIDPDEDTIQFYWEVGETDSNGNNFQPLTGRRVFNVAPPDTQAPEISISYPNATSVNATSPTIVVKGYVTDQNRGGNGVKLITINGVSVSSSPTTGDNPRNFEHSITLNRGANTMTVIATDNKSNSATVQRTIHYNPGRPTAIARASSLAARAGANVRFFAEDSTGGRDGSGTLIYEWDFGDGIIENTSNTELIHHFPNRGGTFSYEVTLKVKEVYANFEEESDPAKLSISVSSITHGGNVRQPLSPDPVNLATGNYIYDHVDLKLPGIGFPFEFARSYNSQLAQNDNGLGFGWSHSYDIRLEDKSNENPPVVAVTFGDGHIEVYEAKGGGILTPEKGVYNTLGERADGTFTLTTKTQLRYEFRADNLLDRIVDRNGNALAIAYTQGGKLDSVTDTVGRKIQFTLDANGRLKTMTDPLPGSLKRVTTWDYDGAGNLIRVTDMRGNITQYSYDSEHRLKTAEDGRGNTFVTNDYDDRGVVFHQLDALNGETFLNFDFETRTTIQTNSLKGVSTYVFDNQLLPLRETDENGNTKYFTYDENLNRISFKDRNGNETFYGYDVSGNVIAKTNAVGAVTLIAYNELNDPILRTNPAGAVTSYGYDAAGNLNLIKDALNGKTRFTHTARGQIKTITDPRNNFITNHYDSEGNIERITGPRGFDTTFGYDPVGRKTSITNANGFSTHFGYDNDDNLIATTNALGGISLSEFDANNNLTSTINEGGANWKYEFDKKDRLIKEIDPFGSTLTHEYDSLNRETNTIDRLGNTTARAFDSVGNLLFVTNALSHVTRFTYDPEQNLLATVDALDRTNRFTYDKLQRLVKSERPDQKCALTEYDARGLVISQTNALGQVTRFQYDLLDRLTNVTDYATGTISLATMSFEYDSAGNRTATIDAEDNRTEVAYNEANQVVAVTAEGDRKKMRAYDNVGNLAFIQTPDGKIKRYTYDGLNRLNKIDYPNGEFDVFFAYDAVGNRTNVVDQLGTTRTVYDLLNRPTAITDPFNRTLEYEYDKNGNRIGLTYPGDNLKVTYGFDALNRLERVKDWNEKTTTYTYDGVNNLTRRENPNGSKSVFKSDVLDRLDESTTTLRNNTSLSHFDISRNALGYPESVDRMQPVPPFIQSGSYTFTYGARNELLTVNSTDVDHDLNGNLQSWTNNAYAFDSEQRLIRADVDSTTTTSRYNGLSQRLERTVDGIRTQYLLDITGELPRILAEYDGDGAVGAYYVYGLTLLSRIDGKGNKTLTYHFDHLGNTIALSDEDNDVADSYGYGPYGATAVRGYTAQPFRFLGAYGIVDDGNGLLALNRRHYSVTLGRFLARDPLGGSDRVSQSFNPYSFALGNPVFFTDLTGLSASEGGLPPARTGASDIVHVPLLYEEFDFAGAFWESMLYEGSSLLDLTELDLREGLFGLFWDLSEKQAIPTRLATYVDTQFGGTRIGELRLGAGSSLDLKAIGGVLKIAAFVAAIKSAVEIASDEFEARDISLRDLGSAWWNAPESLWYGATHPDVAINTGIELSTSATAVAIRFGSVGFIDLSGADVQQYIKQRIH